MLHRVLRHLLCVAAIAWVCVQPAMAGSVVYHESFITSVNTSHDAFDWSYHRADNGDNLSSSSFGSPGKTAGAFNAQGASTDHTGYLASSFTLAVIPGLHWTDEFALTADELQRSTFRYFWAPNWPATAMSHLAIRLNNTWYIRKDPITGTGIDTTTGGRDPLYYRQETVNFSDDPTQWQVMAGFDGTPAADASSAFLPGSWTDLTGPLPYAAMTGFGVFMNNTSTNGYVAYRLDEVSIEVADVAVPAPLAVAMVLPCLLGFMFPKRHGIR